MAEDQVAAMEERSTGRVVKFNDARGFGFIKPDDGGEELFVHHSAISSDGGYRTLSTGDVVEFSVAFSDNKYHAVDVTAPGGGALLPSRRDGFSSRRSGSGFGSTRRSSGGGCYNCGSRDHLARDCDKGNQNNSGGGGCFKCGETGHFARDCNRSGGGYGGGACFNCGRYGHLARDCGGGGGSECYNCGGYGHLARDCSSARVGGRFGAGGGGSGGCFNCGQAGHFARECPSNA